MGWCGSSHPGFQAVDMSNSICELWVTLANFKWSWHSVTLHFQSLWDDPSSSLLRLDFHKITGGLTTLWLKARGQGGGEGLVHERPCWTRSFSKAGPRNGVKRQDEQIDGFGCTYGGSRYCFQVVCVWEGTKKRVGVRVAARRGMKWVALSLPKPPGFSLVPLHMTWPSFFESISSSTLTLWMLARETESERRKEARVRGAKCGLIRAGGEGGQMEGVW